MEPRGLLHIYFPSDRLDFFTHQECRDIDRGYLPPALQVSPFSPRQNGQVLEPNSGDHRWWWKAFIVPAFVGIYVLFYAWVYFVSFMKVRRFTAVIMYFLFPYDLRKNRRKLENSDKILPFTGPSARIVFIVAQNSWKSL
jgi:Endomembrane protein 70